MMNKIVIRDLLILSAVVLATLLPFINKPFNVDDPFYLKAAEQFARDPMHPYSFSINWSGELRDVWGRMEATFPPLVTAYTAAILKAFGEKEWIFHIFFLVFPLTAVISMYFIARKFTDNPLIASILLAVCPSFLVSSTSIMLDVPLCALMLCSIALFIYGAESGNHGKMVLASVIVGLAVLAKYSGLMAVPVLVFYLYFQADSQRSSCHLEPAEGGSTPREILVNDGDKISPFGRNDKNVHFLKLRNSLFSKRMKYAFYMLIPLVILGLWCLQNEIVYKGVHFLLASKHIGKGISLHKVFAFGTFFSGCFIFPVALIFTASLKEARALAVWMIALLVFANFIFTGFFTAVLFAVFCTATLYFIYKVLLERHNIDGFLLAWFFIALCAVMALEPWMSARYLLIILPPAAIIFAKIIVRISEKRRNILVYASVSAALVFGVSLTVSDYIWAEAYKNVAVRIQDKGYNNGHFLGHFGFQYYLEKAGMTALEVNKPLASGGYLIAARIPDPQKPSGEIAGVLKIVDTWHLESGFPLRLMNPRARAGFYSSYWGILPFNFSMMPVDDVIVFSVENVKDH